MVDAYSGVLRNCGFCSVARPARAANETIGSKPPNNKVILLNAPDVLMLPYKACTILLASVRPAMARIWSPSVSPEAEVLPYVAKTQLSARIFALVKSSKERWPAKVLL